MPTLVCQCEQAIYSFGRRFAQWRAQHTRGRVLTEPSIGLPLSLVVELVPGAVVRKVRRPSSMFQDIDGLVAYERGLKVDQDALVGTGEPVVVNGPDHCMALREAVFALLQR